MQTYLVGGAVRDSLLKRPVTERDWVVVGATPEEMLSKGFQQVGKDFPVFLRPPNNISIPASLQLNGTTICGTTKVTLRFLRLFLRFLRLFFPDLPYVPCRHTHVMYCRIGFTGFRLSLFFSLLILRLRLLTSLSRRIVKLSSLRGGEGVGSYYAKNIG